MREIISIVSPAIGHGATLFSTHHQECAEERQKKMYEILIVGSGPAGLTAAIYAARANKKVAILEGMEAGGQLMKTTHVENFPGFSKAILGPDLMQEMKQQAINCGAEVISNTLVNIEKQGDVFNLITDAGSIKAKCVIIATGASAKWLGIENDFIGYGVSNCATCDGSFFKNKTVCVIGGGNSAFEEALYLSNIAKKIYLIHRKGSYNAEDVMQQRLFAKDNIERLNYLQAKKFIAKENSKLLGKIELEHVETKEVKEIEVDGAFIAIGHIPNTSFLKGVLDLDSHGYVKESITTKVPGLYVAGDVHDAKYRQAVTAAGFGCMAALDALKYLE